MFDTPKPKFNTCQVILRSILVLNLSAAELSWWIRGNQEIRAAHMCELISLVSSHSQCRAAVFGAMLGTDIKHWQVFW